MTTGSKRQRTASHPSSTFNDRERNEPFDWFLFPAPAATTYLAGDKVVVKPAASNDKLQTGTIKEIISGHTPKSTKYSLVLEHHGSKEEDPKSVIVPRKRLMKLLEASAAIVVTAETCHYRQLAHLVRTQDSVLEIGCSTGATSRYLIRFAQAWTGLDTSDEMLEKCAAYCSIVQKEMDKEGGNGGQTRHTCGKSDMPVHLAKVDALRDPRSALREVAVATPSPTVVFIDIGGNRELLNVQRMLKWVTNEFATSVRLVVLKSQELAARVRDANEVDATTGHISGLVNMTAARLLPKHPQRAPLALSPEDGVTPICRYHNYHVDGCAKHVANKCRLDHVHCHACLKRGHVGRDCPEFQSENR